VKKKAKLEKWREFGFKKKPSGWLGRGGSGANKERPGIKARDGRHYWLTPPELMKQLKKEFKFTFDACPYPRPKKFCGLEKDWGKSTYVNPPFYGPTAWARKAIHEHKKGKTVVMVFPTDKWIHYLINAGAELRSLGDVKWCAIEDGKPGKGIGRYTMAFILRGKKRKKI